MIVLFSMNNKSINQNWLIYYFTSYQPFAGYFKEENILNCKNCYDWLIQILVINLNLED